jgi:hypothetical protein
MAHAPPPISAPGVVRHAARAAIAVSHPYQPAATEAVTDPVNHPPHYTAGRFEVIDILEDAAQHAPDPVCAGLQWQVLKYLLRM